MDFSKRLARVAAVATWISLALALVAAGVMEYAGDLLTHVHIADTFDHTASSGLRYIVNPPGSPARVHSHLDIGAGDVPWDEFFSTLGALQFDGIATVCVFSEERRAHESMVYCRQQVEKHISSW